MHLLCYAAQLARPPQCRRAGRLFATPQMARNDDARGPACPHRPLVPLWALGHCCTRAIEPFRAKYTAKTLRFYGRAYQCISALVQTCVYSYVNSEA